MTLTRGRLRDEVKTRAGVSITGANITVRSPGTTTLWPVYAAESGGSALSQPISSDANGAYAAYAAPGKVDVFISGVPGMADMTLPNVIIPADPNEQVDKTNGTATGLTVTGGAWNGGTITGATFVSPVGLLTTSSTDTLTNKTLVSPVIRGAVQLRQTGPVMFDVDGYADAADLNADGTFKINVNSSYAWNLGLDALRAATISPGGFGWASGRGLRAGSSVYLIENTLKFIDLDSVTVTPAFPGMAINLYSGDGWAGPMGPDHTHLAPGHPDYDGTPAYLAGVAASLTQAQMAAKAPMVDCTGMKGVTVWGLQLQAQKVLDGSPAPTVRPAVGWLVAANQTYDTATAPTAWDRTNGNSGNNTFMSCGASGWTKYADWALIGTALTTLHACAGQSFSNEANSMSLYVGCTALNTSGDPDPAGTAFDSVWYPDDSTPATGQKRMLRIRTGQSAEDGGTSTEVVIIRSEFHDMFPNVAGNSDFPSDSSNAQTNKKRTILIHRVNGLRMLDVPISGSGIAQIELHGQSQNVHLDMCQNYNKGGSGARTNYFIRVMNVNNSNPIKGLTITNLMGTTAPQLGWIGCGTASADDSPAFVNLSVRDNNLTNGMPFFKTLGSYSGAAGTVNLTNSDIDLNGCSYEFGGSIGETVRMWNVPSGGEQWGTSGSNGTNRAKRHYTNGSERLYGPLTVDSGAIVASAGDVTGRHVTSNGAAIVTGDIALTGDWGSSGGTKSIISGNDMGFKFRVTASAGAVSANPVATITFKTAFANAPIAHVSLAVNGVLAPASVFWVEAASTLQITYLGTVTNGTTYDFRATLSAAA